MSLNRQSKTDRRAEPRYPARLEAIVDDTQHGRLVFTASGFSRTGAFLRRRDSGTPLPRIGGTIKLSFNWPIETHIPPVLVEAKVVRHTNDGIGVQFEIV
ncbi:MAG TPA: PilZ domain-containing protein [Burkholderiales bacterium]|nr:PilZ domain-containing protein [Burkholderiales bacterium]